MCFNVLHGRSYQVAEASILREGWLTWPRYQRGEVPRQICRSVKMDPIPTSSTERNSSRAALSALDSSLATSSPSITRGTRLILCRHLATSNTLNSATATSLLSLLHQPRRNSILSRTLSVFAQPHLRLSFLFHLSLTAQLLLRPSSIPDF